MENRSSATVPSPLDTRSDHSWEYMLPTFKFPPDETKAKVLEILERIRQCNVSQDIDIPELVMSGKQSSGKSSVLEALTGLEFPKGDGGPCTRFVIEIRLYPGAESNFIASKVRFRPTEDERKHSEAFEYREELLPVYEKPYQIIEHAKEVMGITDKKKFAPHVLSIEYHFPDHKARSSAPRLTLVDLPGLIAVEDGEDLEQITRRYIERDSALILAVVDAAADPETHRILELAKKFDPACRRTFGIITKPDMAYPSSDLESAWVNEVLNPERWFMLGAHVLFNRDPLQIQSGEHHIGLTERRQQEAKFFEMPRRFPPNAQDNGDNRRISNGWHNLYTTHNWGIENLRNRLVVLLSDMAINQLGSIYSSVEAALNKRMDELNEMVEKDPRHIRIHLTANVYRLRTLAYQAWQGDYRDVPFFDVSRDGPHWLRSRLAAKGTRFSEKMRSQGHDLATFNWKPDEPLPDNPRSKDVDQMLELLQRTRSGSHPAEFSPDRIGLVLGSFSKPWKGIAADYLDECYTCCEDFVREAVYFVLDDRRLAERLLVKEIFAKLRRRKEEAQHTLDLIENDRKETPMSMSPDMWMGIGDDRIPLAHTLNESVKTKSAQSTATSGRGLGTQAQTEFAKLDAINRDNALKLLRDMLKRNLLRDFDALFTHEWMDDDALFGDIITDPDATEKAKKQARLGQDVNGLSSALEELRPLLGRFSH
ncbi:Interferon-induced GTP-binding Mx [Fusarium albosuccineum]|uniref:Interferon-induced GTP-binding Mx n=1 Tax=Fusarium albosuccineum TaxID=1237068 RepID=A0A8H4KXE9_9HYPO|nr:Interferon-induced GTP-binding Mx [Fusarium albosuccineum]